MNSFAKQEGSGLLEDYYDEDKALSDSLMKRRQKLAQDKLGLQADSEDTDSE